MGSKIRDQLLASRKAKFAGVVSAVLISATPGVYGAWQTAKQAYLNGQEAKTRDSQEEDLQKWVLANKKEIDALKERCATHRDLLDLAIRLQQPDRASRSSRGGARRSGSGIGAGSSERHSTEAQRPTQLDRLRGMVKREDQAARQMREADRQRPKLKSPQELRDLIQKQAK